VAKKRVVGIAIPLTAEQKETIKRISGVDRSEVVFVGLTDKSKRLTNELKSSEDRDLVEAVRESDQGFTAQVEKNPELLYEPGYAGNRSEPPVVGVLR
jgi:hypothetical protein